MIEHKFSIILQINNFYHLKILLNYFIFMAQNKLILMAQNTSYQKDTTKQIILQDISSERATQKHDMELQLVHGPKSSFFWSKKAKIIVTVGLILILIATGLGIGLYYRYRDRMQLMSPVYRVSLGNGEYVSLGEFQLQEKNLFSDDISQKMILTQAIRKNTNENSRLLQQDGQNEEIVDYSATVNLQQVGFELTYNSQNQLGVQVESEKLFDYLMANEPNAARLLAEVVAIEDVNETAVVQDLQKELSQVFNLQLGTLGTFEFHEMPIVELKLNSSTSNYEITDQNGIPIKDARRLLIIRVLFFKQLFQGIKRVVHTIVRPVVEFVRNHGSTIGKVAGGIIGFIAGGPAGAKLGMKIGEGVGLAAQTFVKACVPRDVLTIRCTGQSIKSAGLDLAKDLGKKVISSSAQSIWSNIRK